MDLNTAANILSQQPSEILFDAGDVLVHKLDDGRFLIQKGEHCFLSNFEMSSDTIRE
ncbi:hypothetical protein RII69_003966 [Vibrio parahaemolyticus]|nr:hypothetical protein [Vibrio parahaemolyticus]ELC0687684.1 hypothetical protein [Vibrio parahaemolyticus]